MPFCKNELMTYADEHGGDVQALVSFDWERGYDGSEYEPPAFDSICLFSVVVAGEDVLEELSDTVVDGLERELLSRMSSPREGYD